MGSPDSRSAKCNQFFSSLQMGRPGGARKWKEQFVLDASGNPVQFYVGPDKNAAMVSREVLSKHLKDLVQAMLTGKEVWVEKPNGTLFVD